MEPPRRCMLISDVRTEESFKKLLLFFHISCPQALLVGPRTHAALVNIGLLWAGLTSGELAKASTNYFLLVLI